jgi:uncharacterized protein YjeT (DUF2065 family)
MTINFLAEVWGISIVVVSMAVLIRPKYLTALFAEIENEAKMFCLGLLSFVIGLVMVLTYNVWDTSWQVIVTILGWVTILKGLAVIFFPEPTKKMAKMMENSQFLPYALVALVILGLILTYYGFTTTPVI